MKTYCVRMIKAMAFATALACAGSPAAAATTNLYCNYFEVSLDPDTGRVTHNDPQYGAASVDGAFTANAVTYRVALPALKGLAKYHGEVKIDRTTLRYTRQGSISMQSTGVVAPITSGTEGTCSLMPAPAARKF